MRCWLLARQRLETPASLSLATVGLEKILDGLALVALVVAATWLVDTPPWVDRLALAAALTFGGALAATIAFRRHAARLLGIMRRWRGSRLARATDFLARVETRFTEGLSALGSPRHIAWLTLLSAGVWVAEGSLVWSLARAVGIGLSPAASVVVAAVLGLGLSIPAGPAFVGTYEFFVVAGVGLFGVDATAGLGLSIVMHAWVLLTTGATGCVAMMAGGARWSHGLTMRPQER